MKRARKIFLATLLAAATLLINACGHAPYSPCNGFFGGGCGPEYPINQF